MAPYLNGEIDFQTAWTLTTTPLRAFMLAQIRETDLMTFAGIAGTAPTPAPMRSRSRYWSPRSSPAS